MSITATAIQTLLTRIHNSESVLSTLCYEIEASLFKACDVALNIHDSLDSRLAFDSLSRLTSLLKIRTSHSGIALCIVEFVHEWQQYRQSMINQFEICKYYHETGYLVDRDDLFDSVEWFYGPISACQDKVARLCEAIEVRLSKAGLPRAFDEWRMPERSTPSSPKAKRSAAAAKRLASKKVSSIAVTPSSCSV